MKTTRIAVVRPNHLFFENIARFRYVHCAVMTHFSQAKRLSRANPQGSVNSFLIRLYIKELITSLHKQFN